MKSMKVTEHNITVEDDPNTAWEHLIGLLRLPQGRLYLPHFLESQKTAPYFSPHMDLEVIGGAGGSVIPARLTDWRPNERRVTVGIYNDLGPYRWYEFSVNPSPSADHAEIRLVLKIDDYYHPSIPLIYRLLDRVERLFSRFEYNAETVMRTVQQDYYRQRIHGSRV